MKRILALIAILLGACASAFAQGNSVTILFPGVPSGACSFVLYGINGSNGDLYDCLNGSWHPTGTTTGTGTVTSFSAGTLSPLFTTSVANASTTPALSFTLSNATAHTFFMNNTAGLAAPGFQAPGEADLPATTVFTDKANTFSTGLQTFTAATMALPASAAYAPTTAGLFGYDTTNNRLVFGNGTTTGIPLWLTSTPTNNQCPKFSGTTGLVVSAACGGVVSITGDGTIITNSASTGAVTLTIAGTSGGIPFFSSTSAWGSSALLTANAVMIGGGAGVAPSTISADTTTTHALFATAGAPAFRALGVGDLPTVDIAHGGTGQTTASNAFNALAPATAAGGVIVGSGTNTYTNLALGAASTCLQVNAGGTALVFASCATGTIGGSGTGNTIPKFTGASTIANSLLTDNATILTYSGTGGFNPSAGPIVFTQIAAPTGAAGSSWLWADSTALRLQMKNGSNTAVNVVASGADINTSDQVTGLHLTGTGLARNGTTAAELSGDATTSGSNAVTVVALRNAALPTLAASTGMLFDTAGTLSLAATLPTSAVPAFTGDMTNSAGSLATTVAKINGTAFSGTAGHVVDFATSTTPGDGGAVAADLITYHNPATGIARTTSSSQALTAAELSGDATTSGSNVVTVVKINGNSVPSGAAAHQTLVATALNALAWKTITDCNGSSNALNYTQSTDVFSCNSIATLTNPMTTLGDMIDGGAAGVVTRLAGPTSGNSPYMLVSLPSGGVATAPVWSVLGVPIDSQSSASPAVAADSATTPDRGKVVLTTNTTTSTATSVPQAGSSGVAGSYAFATLNSGSVVNTMTPTTSTVNGNATLKLVGAVAGHNPEAAFWWSDNTNWWAAEILPTDANGRLGCEGFMALTGDVTNTAGNCATTVGAINGTAFSGTNGHLVSFGASNTPADSGIVAANVVTATGTLTSTAIMTGGGTKTAQTPSTTTTLDGSGNLSVAAGGSVGSADTGTPKFTFATNKVTLNQPLTLGTTSNQLVTGTSTNLTTLTFPASSGAVTLTFPNTTELIVGANSDTTTTHIAHATAVAGIANFAALACADLPALTGDTTTSAGSCATTTAKINGTSVTGTNGDVVQFGAGNTLADSNFLASNVVRKDTTNTAAAAMTLDMSPATGTAAFKVPSNTTNTASAAGVIDYDTTNSNYHGNSGADSIFGIVPTASVPTTGNLIDASVSSSKFLLHDSGVATANVVTAASNFSNGGLVYSNGTAKTTANSADWAIGGAGNHTLVSSASALFDMSAATTAGGLLIPAASYKASAGTGTAGHLACYTSSGTLGNCTGTPSNNFLGVFTTTTAWAASGEVTVALDATVNVTFGDILCASSSSAGTAHDNGSVSCANGEWVGIVKTTAATTATATAFVKMQ